MGVSVTLQQTRTVNPDGTYTVTSTVTTTTGIAMELFVYTASTQSYDHVASVFDVNTFPTSYNPAVAWYRQASVTQTFKNVGDAQEAGNTHKTAIQDLVTAYDAAVLAFQGSDVTVFQ